jgi:serine protease Do
MLKLQGSEGRANRLALYAVSASMFAVAGSNLARPAPATAQAPGQRPVMSGQSRSALVALEDAFVGIAETVGPSVVTISARSAPAPDGEPGFRGGPGRPGTGSGVIIRENGRTAYVLTNNHVVAGRSDLRIQMADQSEYRGEVVGRDPESDLAVVRFNATRPLPAGSVARFGNAQDVKVGQWAIAIGSPLGYRSTMTVGVVSAKGRQLGGGRSQHGDLIQTDASINPGNSGGPLVNIDGEIIGINVAIASNGSSRGNIGIGFAIPCDIARTVSEQLISGGRVNRGYLGVSVSSENRVLKPELRERLGCPNGGALIETVGEGTPAAEAGVRAGDVIVRFGGHAIRSFTDLEKAVLATGPNSAVPVELVRERKPVRLTIRTQERPQEVAEAP